MRKFGIIIVAGLAMVFGSACTGNNFRDVKGVPSGDADSYKLFNNVDGHPNLVRVCADGLAFLTTTRDYHAVERIPEWDHFCVK